MYTIQYMHFHEYCSGDQWGDRCGDWCGDVLRRFVGKCCWLEGKSWGSVCGAHKHTHIRTHGAYRGLILGTMLCNAVVCCIILCYPVLCCAVLCCAVVCSTVQCSAVQCIATQCCIIYCSGWNRTAESKRTTDKTREWELLEPLCSLVPSRNSLLLSSL